MSNTDPIENEDLIEMFGGNLWYCKESEKAFHLGYEITKEDVVAISQWSLRVLEHMRKKQSEQTS